MSRSTAKWLAIILYFVIILLVISFARNSVALIFLTVAFFISYAVLKVFLRCPKCGRGQGKSWLWASYCPHCGELLE